MSVPHVSRYQALHERPLQSRLGQEIPRRSVCTLLRSFWVQTCQSPPQRRPRSQHLEKFRRSDRREMQMFVTLRQWELVDKNNSNEELKTNQRLHLVSNSENLFNFTDLRENSELHRFSIWLIISSINCSLWKLSKNMDEDSISIAFNSMHFVSKRLTPLLSTLYILHTYLGIHFRYAFCWTYSQFFRMFS